MRRSILIIAVVAATFLIMGRRPSAAIETDQHPGATCATAAAAFWQAWESSRPSEAIRRAAPSAELQAAWSGVGRAADEFHDRAGAQCLGHARIESKSLGDSMTYVSFLALYEPKPLRVQMLYYKAKDKWALIAIRVNSSPQRWLIEASGVADATDDSDAKE